MNLTEMMVPTFSTIFAVLILGCYLGRIELWGVSLGLAGVLAVSIVLGCIIMMDDELALPIDAADLQSNLKVFTPLGTALFVSAIGISAGYTLDSHKIKNFRIVSVGLSMVISSFATMCLIAIVDKDVSRSKLLGAFCGALTTTPGFSAVLEVNGVIAEEATIGYGCTYLIGVIATIMSVQIMARESEKPERNAELGEDTGKTAQGGLLQIAIPVVLGQLLGTIRMGDFSLGQSGGMLFCGIVVGIVVRTQLPSKIATSNVFAAYRNLGLILFFIGNGVPAGMSLCRNVDVKIVVYGIFMVVVPIAFGTLIVRLMARENDTSSVIAGGMTSTPAIGLLVQKGRYVDLGSYSLAYAGALITTIILIRLLPLGFGGLVSCL